jgi:F-type H+-transporting ATPase subunit g
MAALGSKLAQLQGKACEATRFVAKHGCAYSKNLLEKNKQYVVDPPTVEKCQELSKQLFYTRLARCDPPLPPTLCSVDLVGPIWVSIVVDCYAVSS